MTEQLSLLDWRPPAEILPFPSHRSHGMTVCVARNIMNLETAKRTGRLNSLRAQTRKRMEPLFGDERADKIADDLLRMIRIQIAYQNLRIPLPKQIETSVVIFSSNVPRALNNPHGYGGGEAIACVPRPQALVAEGSEQEAARVREGGAA